ncbi:hypothetical protein [Caballeronia sp. RCC_10]|uniref:hypothetical protein n=1 Tax=Caballeronia sp. RCC_10 TaxID=3239227 RepID=UPI003524C7E8
MSDGRGLAAQAKKIGLIVPRDLGTVHYRRRPQSRDGNGKWLKDARRACDNSPLPDLFFAYQPKRQQAVCIVPNEAATIAVSRPSGKGF